MKQLRLSIVFVVALAMSAYAQTADQHFKTGLEIRLDPNTGHNYAMRAEVYEKKGLKDVAIGDYRAAQKLDPANAFAKAGLARLGATP